MKITNRLSVTRLLIILAGIAVALTINCGTSEQDEPSVDAPVAQTAAYDGEESFQNRCAVCHGPTAEGTQTGPPLVNRLYEIGHQPSFSFHNAVNKGVTAHHWNFGDMPPIPNVPPEEIDAIICHVRDLQRAEGIEAGEPCKSHTVTSE